MRTQTTEKTKLDTTRLVKRNANILKMTVGDKFEGIYKGSTEGPWVDPKTGQEKTLTRLHFLVPGTSDRVIIFQDSGLRNAFANAMVAMDEHIVIEKLDKVKLTGGHTCNQYDIFAIQGELN